MIIKVEPEEKPWVSEPLASEESATVSGVQSGEGEFASSWLPVDIISVRCPPVQQGQMGVGIY